MAMPKGSRLPAEHDCITCLKSGRWLDDECTECKRADRDRTEYMRRYREANREKMREYHREFRRRQRLLKHRNQP